MNLITAMKVFNLVVMMASLTVADDIMMLSATVSRYIKAWENDLGARLIAAPRAGLARPRRKRVCDQRTISSR